MSTAASLEEILRKIQLILARNGISVMRRLKKLLQEFDTEGSKEISSEEFAAALMRTGFFLSQHEYANVFKAFKADSLQVNYQQFVDAIQTPLNETRLGILEELFSALKDGNTVSSDKLVSTFDASNHPKVKVGQLTAMQVQDTFAQAVDGMDKEIGKEMWMEYFLGISAAYPYNDSKFVEFVTECWHTAFVKRNETEKKVGSLAFLEQVNMTLAEKVEQKVRGGSNETTLINAFKHFDLNSSGTVEFGEFVKTLEVFGIILPDKDAKLYFEQFDTNGNGKIDYKEFTSKLFEN